jgi:hypothetical protein
MMAQTMAKVFVAFMVVLLVLFWLRRPVLFTFADFGEISRPSIAIFNPLRDRTPERIADEMLDDLRRGDVDVAMSQVQGGASPEIADKERRYQVRRWKLVNRIDHADQVVLYYRIDRGMSRNLDSEVVVSLQERNRGWVVRDYLPMY